jgi:release factor glutamine methyltransferase
MTERIPAPAARPQSGQPRRWTVLELLRWTQGHFAAKGIESARLDAECLLAAALGCDRLRLYLDFEKPVGAEERARFRELVRQRADERVPVAQLVGRKEFWSLPFEVTPDVLVPRPETETLVDWLLGRVREREAELRVLDLGTGSGAIAVALASELPKAHVTATDLSPAALAVAARNAERNGVADRVAFLAGDGFAPVAGERFDLVASNPPYVALRDEAGLPPELRHEPRAALFAGPDGTDLLRRLAAEVGEHLAPGGAAAFEVGEAQADTVARWLQAAGLREVGVVRDAAARPRVVTARAAEAAPADRRTGGGPDGESS